MRFVLPAASVVCLALVFVPGCEQPANEAKGPTMKTESPTTAVAAAIHWLPWGPEVFELAREQDKLILFDSGATWCHWCHVMDRVTYEDKEVIELVMKKFIAVRIDRDRLPDVDHHFQRAVPLIRSGGNGWPLTVILTPDGHLLYKATFVPPRADLQYGAGIGLIDLLNRLDEVWRTRREEIARVGREMKDALRKQRGDVFSRKGKLHATLIDQVYAGIAARHDPAYGGFGGAPKFFSAPAIDVVLTRAWAGDANATGILTHTLESIARGGVYDHVGGGFHRYSVDARWHVPHFEKMAYDNAALLALYANAAALTGREDFARVARETRQWLDRVLGGSTGRGFYSSQDADVGLDDDGDYFTWTVAEVKEALGAEGREAPAVLAHYVVEETGDMRERPDRNVLHAPRAPGEVAESLEMKDKELGELISRSLPRLLAARRKRPTPLVDKTVFADLNGMLIDAYLTAYERLGNKSARQTALATLDHLLGDLRDDRGVFAHYRAAGGADGLRGVGMLADQAWMARALLHAYAVTVDEKYLAAARTLADHVLQKLTDADGAFLNIAKAATTHPATVEPSKGWEDGPSRSAASVAAGMLIDLGHVAADERYARAGAKALASFAGGVQPDWGLFLAGYGPIFPAAWFSRSTRPARPRRHCSNGLAMRRGPSPRPTSATARPASPQPSRPRNWSSASRSWRSCPELKG
jgi:uncharacterized protein YyaL (SSP411 family)